MHLLERQEQLEILSRGLQEARAGCGKLVLISGEAGLGKSSLVEHFVSGVRCEARTLWGACDALATPRALGPVHEIAAQTALAGGGMRDEASRDWLFRALLEDLARSDRPAVVVLEDLHWADEATLDFFRFMGRRVQRTSALFLATYRDDELPPLHPLRLALGELTGHHVIRMRLVPLSPAAVAELAQESGRDTALVHQITGGNPFFVREVLASPGERVPETVRDAVLARLARCSPATRELAEMVSMSPRRTEEWLIGSVLGPRQAAIDEGVARGLLVVHDDAAVAFRHELARLAVHSSLAPERARSMHQRVLEALLERSPDLTELLHHATLAHNVAVVLEHAPRAAREAARLGAHREAAAHLGAALRCGASLPAAARAELLEQHARECSLANQARDAIASATQALPIYRDAANTEAQSRLLRLLSQEYRNVGDKTRADECVAGAIALLETLPPSANLARAYNARSLLATHRGWDREGLEYGRRALGLARQFGDAAIESQALGNIGSALLGSADPAGYEMLERSLALALGHGLEEEAARAYRSFLFYAVLVHDFARAATLYGEGVAYCEERGIYVHSAYMRAYYTPVELERGNWTEAARLAGDLLGSPELTGVQQRVTLLVTLALVRARRGDPGADELLDEAFGLALPTSELNRIGRIAAARAEQAWYRGDLERVAREADLGLEHVGGHTAPWIRGELLMWQARAGGNGAGLADVADPWRLMLTGDWRGAATAWQRIGMPYEQALALAEGSEEEQRDALAILEMLGAGPLLAIVRRRLRERGARGISRGPNETTRTNPAGLTAREIEVVALLAQGCSNAQLARRLHRSPKTIDHHVSAILAKLNVRSRTEAVAAAFSLGILSARAESASSWPS